MKKKTMIGAALTTAAVTAMIPLGAGFLYGKGPFRKLIRKRIPFLKGNQSRYDASEAGVYDNSPLRGKNVIFLGSSVTYGAASCGVSFVEDLCARHGCTMVKEAVSGTTLVDLGSSSYISRMKTIDASVHADLFVCQLSTNDATKNLPLGKVSASRQLSDFDTSTVAGAIEYIIAYASSTWNCPVVFYTNPVYDSTSYQNMVSLLLQIQKKWKIGVIDLWNDAAFNTITDSQKKLYMADPIHPTKAGYLLWWTPYIEAELVSMLNQ